ncbi:MAG: alkaline phosphatase family protein [Vicinamibacteria bacterium]
MNLLFALALALAPAQETPRVIVISFDGAGFTLTSRFLAEGKLPNFERMVREGAWSDGMVTSFPTKTAAAHALLFTGQHGHTSGITGNSVLKFPPSAGSRLDTVNGYSADPLRSETVWMKAAGAGLETYVFHAPQVYPFRPQPHLNVVYGYTSASSRGEALSPAAVLQAALDPAWMIPEPLSEGAREIRFEVGESWFRGFFFDDPIDPTIGCDTLAVAAELDLSNLVARLKPGEGESFSDPIAARIGGKKAWFSLRLFELEENGSDFVLYRSGASELAISPDDLGGSETPPVLQVYAGNGGTRAYSASALGGTIPQGGLGDAERRFLDTESHLASQLMEQARWALARDYRLLVLYSPVTDDVAHELYGYVAADRKGYDESLARKIWPAIEEGFRIQDRFLGLLLEAADRDSAHVIVVSDHGMSGTDKLIHLNLALERAGLLDLGEDRRIDLSRTRALAPPLADASIAVNTTDRPGGIVPLEEKALVLDRVRAALSALTDPSTGVRIVTEFFEPETSGLLQPGGASTGDLFLDFAPGYYPSTDTVREAVVESTEPSGEHVFVPTRRDMLAIFAAYGPRIPKGTGLGRVRALDVTPTILDLLGLEPSADLPGRSLVPGRGILN